MMVKNDKKGCLAELRFKPVLTEALYMGFSFFAMFPLFCYVRRKEHLAFIVMVQTKTDDLFQCQFPNVCGKYTMFFTRHCRERSSKSLLIFSYQGDGIISATKCIFNKIFSMRHLCGRSMNILHRKYFFVVRHFKQTSE
jgi:hypothetical protein